MIQELSEQIAEKQARAIDDWMVPLFNQHVPGWNGLRAKYIIGDRVVAANLARFLKERGFYLEMEQDITSPMKMIYRFKKGDKVLGELRLETIFNIAG